MVNTYANIPERYQGSWCDTELAEMILSHDSIEGNVEEDEPELREAWAEALNDGDLKMAHRLWGKWQGYSGKDPWEDDGWRNFWEAQNIGATLWEDFDASKVEERILLKTYISYWDQESLNKKA